MTPNDVKVVLYEVLGGGVFLNTPAFAILICGSLLAVAVAAGVGAFFGKRGETAAVKRDIATIKQNLAEMTQATEKIKAEISGEEWLKQRRWQIKWDCYSKLAEDLGELATLLQEVRFILGRGPVPGLDQAAIDNKVTLNQAAANAAMERHRRYASIARIVIPADARTFLSTFAEEWNRTILLEDQYRVAHKAWVEVLDIARADLLGEPREIQPATKGITA